MIAASVNKLQSIAPIVEAVLLGAFVGILVLGAAWIFLYKGLNRRLAVIRPATGERRNAMDLFFNKLMFLIGGEDKRTGDAAVSRYCLGLRICTALLVLCFLTMVFGPFLLGK